MPLNLHGKGKLMDLMLNQLCGRW